MLSGQTLYKKTRTTSNMKTIFTLALLLLSLPTHATCVILLHGLARTKSSMNELEQKLTAQAYKVVNLGYPSTDHNVEKLAELSIGPAIRECGESSEINFVTHSLGGILVREYLSKHQITNLKYTVMLGPPNKGSEVVDKLRDVPGFYFLNGDAGLQLGTDVSSKPNTLGPVTFNLGVIAGNRSINWILSSLIPGNDDGKVSIQRTKIEGMTDHIVLPTTHTFMMKNNKVIAQVIYYLKNGHFERPS